MREYVASVTRRGQVTIPAEIRRLLGTKERPKVVFRVKDGEIRVAPVEMTLEEVFGSVTPLNRPEAFEELSRIAKEEKVLRTIEEMQRS